MPKLDRPDASVHYDVSGEGPPLLMIAGFMSDSASWAPLLPLLEPHFTLIRPDNRSAGQTTPWNAPCGPKIWAEDTFAIMDACGHDSFHVAGHSLGGLIGWQMAYMNPERITSLLIAGSAPRHFARNTALFRALIDVRRSDSPPETWLRLLFPWLFHPDTYDNPAAIETMIAASMAYPYAQSADAMEHQLDSLYDDVDPTPFMSVPKVRLRALLADADLLVPRDLAEPTLPDVDTHIISNAGHSIHWDVPEAVAQHILDLTRGAT